MSKIWSDDPTLALWAMMVREKYPGGTVNTFGYSDGETTEPVEVVAFDCAGNLIGTWSENGAWVGVCDPAEWRARAQATRDMREYPVHTITTDAPLIVIGPEPAH